MSDRDYDPYARLDPVPSFPVTSTDVVDGEPLPAAMYGESAGGQDRSPQLSWSDPPAGTKSFAVTMYDPDAPTGSGFWHWAVADIPADVTSLESGAEPPAGAVVLHNELRQQRGYTGATPPQGTGVHRYYVVVHAVDVESLGVDPDSTPAVLGFNLHFHTLGRAILVGTGEFEGAAAGSPGV
jgi:Raf kinase inhibitor-like YbhB/YbcL family protein